MKHIEIERKWIVKKEYKDKFEPSLLIHCKYFSSLSPLSLRIQSKFVIGSAVGQPYVYWLTIKSEGSLSRIEIEKELTEDEFKILSTIKHFTISKLYNNDFYGLQTSIASNQFGKSLFYAEKEFETELEANEYVPPDIVEREVTYQSEYKMANFAMLQN
jgi:CYTH domain-containing protein